MLKCSYCSKPFKYESEKKRHEQSHTPQFECKVCTKKFSFLSALRRHQKQHERTGSVQCDECGRNFRDNTLLKRHITYSHKGTYICSKCDAKFNSDLALISHLKTHRPDKERRYKCSYCGCKKTFNFPHHLKHHELTHTNTKQHYCKICGKGFIQAHHLKSHSKNHESEHLLPCTVTDCNKKFATEYARKRHLVTHSQKNKSEGEISTYIICNIPENSVKEISCDKDQIQNITPNEEKCKKKSFEVLTKEIKDDNESNNNDIDVFNNCKSVLGKCIADGDTNCLCAQINYVNHFYDSMLPNDNFEPTKLNEVNIYDDMLSQSIMEHDNFEPNKLNKVKICDIMLNQPIMANNSVCEGCECSKSERDNVTVQLTKDGAIKIKDTFDFDLDFIGKKENGDFSAYGCKAALGRCIVSGSGDISDECLCAKMAMDDQIAQEIDEITPQPNVSS